ADVDKGDVLLQQPINDSPLGLSGIEAEECKSDAFKEIQIVLGQRLVVFCEAAPPLFTVDVKKCLYLRFLLLKVGKGPRAGRPERIVGVEAVAIKNTNLRDPGLGDEVEHIRAGPADTHDRDVLVFELLIVGTDMHAAGRG